MNGPFSKVGILAGLAAALALPASAGTTTYQIDPRHSSAGFGVTHLMISTVRGEFHGVTGTVVVDDTDIAKSSVNVTIDATTKHGIEVVGFINGFKHLVEGRPQYRKLSVDDVAPYYMRGGSILGTARTNPAKKEEDMQRVLKTFAEMGMGAYNVTSWYGVAFPGGTPAAIVQKANKAMVEALARDSVIGQMRKMGALVRSSTPEELKAHIAGEIAKWKAVREKASIEQEP